MDRAESGGTGARWAGVGAGAWLIDAGRITVSVAARPELAIVADILDEASAWSEGRGAALWPRPFPVEVLEASLARGETYLARAGAVAVGTFALHRTDPTFWGERPDEPLDHARYLHKLAVRRGNPGLGRALVGVAETIARAEGVACLRLDCDASRPRLCRYYEELGFEQRGYLDMPRSNWRASLYEKSPV
jgi:ribosomal protein S18 acetylase RimI-like enzyme